MPHRTFDDGFFSASRARDIAIGDGSSNNAVLLEINALQVLIDEAARGGNLSLEVGTGPGNATSFTDAITGPAYREAFVGTQESFDSLFPTLERLALLTQMERVIGYFTRLGYLITRVDQPSNVPTTFNWIIKW